MLDRTSIETWLYQEIRDLGATVSEAHLFGSILGFNKLPSDIDLMTVFNNWNVKAECTALKKSFRHEFGITLHIQMFHFSQAEEIRNFFEQAKETRKIL